MSRQLGLFMEDQTIEEVLEVEKETYEYTLNRDTILIFLMSKYYGYDINIMHLLYEKYDKDFLYFFYMQPIKKGNIPSFSRIAYLIKSSNILLQEILNKGYASDYDLDLSSSKEILKELNSIINLEKMVMKIDLGMTYDLED